MMRLILILLTVCMATQLFAQDDVEQLEQQALYAAATQAAPSVVRIETIGGLEKVGQVLVNVGPTSGIVVDPDGYLISSEFNFIQDPNSILVQLPNGTRKPATIVSRDHARRLVLLKVDVDEPLAMPAVASVSDLRIGQWTVTVGRTLPGDDFYMSVGILSAKNRIWGKAVQSDANVSPANYGGALVDIHGKLIGVLVPLSPDSNEVVAGAEWYDSGIGFAVPYEDILRLLPQLKQGDLYPGKLGIAMKSADLYGAAAEIGVCRPKSPARDAGLKPGDKFIRLNDVPVHSHADLKHQLGPLLAGETVKMEVERDGDRIVLQAVLTDKLLPYEHAFLGVLPVRELQDSELAGVAVRHVLKESPADRAEMQVGDTITQLNETPIASIEDLRNAIAALEPNAEVTVSYTRPNAAAAETPETDQQESDTPDSDTFESLTASLQLQSLPESVPAELPDGYPDLKEFNEDLPQLGKINIKLPEEAGECQAYIPATYDPRFQHALVVLLPVPGSDKTDDLIKAWKAQCDATRSILLMPQAKDARSWLPTETAFIRKTIENLRSTYAIDPERIVIHGVDSSGSMAFLTAFTHRDLVRGVSAINASVPRRAPPVINEPLQRLAVYMLSEKEGRTSKRITGHAKQLRELKLPVTTNEYDGEFDEHERAELLRWVDMLDRL